MRSVAARRRLVVGLVIALCAASVAAGCADRLILPPVPRDVAHDGSERRTIGYPNGNLEVFVARSPGAAAGAGPRAFVLRFSGDAAGAAKFTASRWGERPVEVWVVNYPGYGGSTGSRTLRNLAGASLAAYDQLRAVAGERPIFVEGFSLGTTPALHVAAERPVAGVILQNPPPLRELILGSHGWWNLWLLAGPVASQVPRELDSLANARACKSRAVFLVADSDRTIPPKYQQRIVDAWAGQKRLIVQKGADHVAPLDAEAETRLHAGMDWLLAGAVTKPPTPAAVGSTRPAR